MKNKHPLRADRFTLVPQIPFTAAIRAAEVPMLTTSLNSIILVGVVLVLVQVVLVRVKNSVSGHAFR